MSQKNVLKDETGCVDNDIKEPPGQVFFFVVVVICAVLRGLLSCGNAIGKSPTKGDYLVSNEPPRSKLRNQIKCHFVFVCQ